MKTVFLMILLPVLLMGCNNPEITKINAAAARAAQIEKNRYAQNIEAQRLAANAAADIRAKKSAAEADTRQKQAMAEQDTRTKEYYKAQLKKIIPPFFFFLVVYSITTNFKKWQERLFHTTKVKEEEQTKRELGKEILKMLPQLNHNERAALFAQGGLFAGKSLEQLKDNV